MQLCGYGAVALYSEAGVLLGEPPSVVLFKRSAPTATSFNPLRLNDLVLFLKGQPLFYGEPFGVSIHDSSSPTRISFFY